MPSAPLLQLQGICKAFSGVQALRGVDLEIRPGEIHALVGENGAGKSTLIRILSGALSPDSGEIRLDGRPAALASPRQSRAAGIAAAHQELELFAWRTALENCFNQRGLPGGFFIDWKAAASEAREALSRLGADFPILAPTGSLSASQKQLVALAGALLARPRLLILDEPTAALTAAESDRLFSLLRGLRNDGKSVLYVSHRLGEVMALADRVTVLRDGRAVLSAEASRLDEAALVEAMVGRRVETLTPRPSRPPAAASQALEAAGLSDAAGAFSGVSFSVAPGEVLGIYGLVGAGRSELGQALAGLRASRGGIRARGRIAYLPEDRIAQGNLPGLSLRENLTISALAKVSRGPLLEPRRERALAAELRERLRIRSSSVEAEIGTLSGGNQQKALVGRWLAVEPDILILDEPTQGIDVGARAEIHQLIASLAGAGRAIVLISSDLPEALGLSHRLLVLREGQVAATFDSERAGQEEVARAALPLEGSAAAEMPYAVRGASAAKAAQAVQIARAAQAAHAAQPAHPAPARGAAGPARRMRALPAARWRREAALLVLLAAILIVTEIKAPGFASLATARDLAANGASLALAALGLTLVIAGGGIDISIGAILGLSAAAAARCTGAGAGVALSLAAALFLGLALGTVNAGLTLLGRLHPLIVTLGTLGIFQGLFLAWTGGDWLILPSEITALASSGPAGVPWPAWVVASASALLFGFMRWTRLGRACLTAGDNPRAARTHGQPVALARLTTFAVLGALVGVAGVLHTARFGKVQSNTGVGFELLAIAAAVVGGAPVAGGRGTVAGALLGAALIGLLQDARAVWGIHERWQLITVGCLMLAAIAIESILPGRRERRGA